MHARWQPCHLTIIHWPLSTTHMEWLTCAVTRGPRRLVRTAVRLAWLRTSLTSVRLLYLFARYVESTYIDPIIAIAPLSASDAYELSPVHAQGPCRASNICADTCCEWFFFFLTESLHFCLSSRWWAKNPNGLGRLITGDLNQCPAVTAGTQFFNK
jgi:hypothetical protein